MATKLKNLKIKKVDFVDNGANPGASIALYKSKPAEGKTPAVKPEEGTPPEESFLKRIVHAIAKSIGATDAQAAAAVEEVSKNADVPTFCDAMARRRMRQTTEEIWDYCYALNDSLCGIVANAEITAEDKKALMAQSCAEFAAATEAAIPKWSGGIPVKLEKAAPTPLTPDRIENAKAARARLDEMIAKAEPKPATEDTPPEPPKEGADPTPPADPQREEPVQKGAFDMEIDKSKLSAEEVAQLEAIEKKAGIPAKATPAVPAGVEKAAPATPADNATGGEEDIYKGIHPDVAKEIAELRKFRQDAENRELLAVAKKYELLGKKPEELVPVLKSLKAAGGTAYNDKIVYITQLDTGTRIALPLTPEKVSDKREGNFISYNILNVGEVKIPNGEKLAQFSWDGILPGVSMLGMGIVSLFDWKPPRVMIGILDGWKKNRKKLRLLVTGTAINHDVYIQNFTVTHEYLDRAEYSISFVQAKDILIKTTDEADGKTDGGSLDERPASAAAAASTQATGKTYTVKPGDTLWSISKKYLGNGSRYSEIYNSNKAVIGSNPGLIKPGQVLTIPG